MENHDLLNSLQKNHMDNDLYEAGRDKIHQSWFFEDTVDFWRHNRMYQTISPLANQYKNKKWLSVGDGRFGLDSIRLKKLFDLDVFPTDISENMLRESKELGFLNQYGVENAESLSFKDNSFDVVFCKESFHHFPRPLVALYEMIRVSKYAVILIEPNDNQAVTFSRKKYLLSAINIIFNSVLNKKSSPYFKEPNSAFHRYEDSGNYVYTLSNHEIDKIVHALYLKGTAFFEFNDSYIEGVEFEKAQEDNEMFKQLKNNIKDLDESGANNLTTTIIFKSKINSDLKSSLIAKGYTFAEKFENPKADIGF